MKGSTFNRETAVLNFVNPDPNLAKSVEQSVKEEKKTHFDLNPKAARMSNYWAKTQSMTPSDTKPHHRFENSKKSP